MINAWLFLTLDTSPTLTHLRHNRMFKKKSLASGGKRNQRSSRKQTSDSESDSSSSESDVDGSMFKRRKKTTGSGGKRTVASTEEATKPDFSSAIDHSHSKTLAKSDEATKETILFAKDDSDEDEKFGTGPYTVPFTKPAASTMALKASSNIRSTTAQDYQPDVCKDYKQTGFCGYGDACKFLHMREDYKAGWQIERDWEISKDGKNDKAVAVESQEKKKDDGGIPDKCPICEGPFKSPVVTQCKHYFCEKCFLTRYKKRPGCAVCGANTKGACKPVKL